jgi:hypothetical protein
MITTLTVIVLCTMQNYIQSNCIPDELLNSKVEICEYERDENTRYY